MSRSSLRTLAMLKARLRVLTRAAAGTACAMAMVAPAESLAAPASPPEGDTILSIQAENDLFLGGTDHHYTHGTRFSFLSQPIQRPWIKDWLSNIPYFIRDRDNADIRVNLSFGQSMFTPDDITLTTLQKDDRPYAGWLYGGAGIISRGVDRDGDAERRPLGIKRLEVDVGVIGPLAFAGQTQTFVHATRNLDKPKGWGLQLPNEPAFVLYGERLWGPYDLLALDQVPVLGELGIDIAPHFGGALGNVFTYAATGLTLRLGSNLRDTWSPPRIRPSLPGAELYDGGGIKGYIFAAGEARAVARNIFLDGSTFGASHSVTKHPVVLDVQLGFAMMFGQFQLSYTQIFRTREFEGQIAPDNFGALSLSLAI